MADEKPKGTSSVLTDYIKGRVKPLGLGTKILMGGEDPELDAVRKTLAERGQPITPELLQKLALLIEDPVAVAQKRAAETGQVDLAAANEWLMSHWPMEKRLCPVCQVVQWSIGPSFAQIPINVIGSHSSPRTNPCVAVVCGNCGNTLFFNAIVMGLLPKGTV